MVTTPAERNIQLIKELMSKDISDQSGKFTSDPLQKQKNTFDAVKDLFIGLLDPEAVDLIRSQTKGTGSASLDSKFAGVGIKGNNQFYPSFNIRTPIVEVILNGIPIYPNKLDLDTGEEIKNAKLNFDTFNLTMPMGGVEKTITGAMTFFTKNPEEILAYLNVGSTGVSNSTDFSTSGLPTITLKFGWAFSDSSTLSKISKAISPKLSFLITNITMTDPGVGGTTFTLALQELGTTVLEHSSDDLLFDSDYPQQQLRTLLEGLLHVRLFTLDDLLYLGPANGIGSVPTHSGGAGNPTTITKSLAASSVSDATTLNAPDINAVMTADEAKALLTPGFNYPTFNPSLFVNQSLNPPTLTSQSSPSPESNTTSSTPQYILNAADHAFISNTKQQPIVNTVQQTQTFFTTQPGAPFGVNGKNFFTVATELASHCRCLWYPHKNGEDAVKASAESQKAITSLTALSQDLKMLKELPSNVVTLDEKIATQVRKTIRSVVDNSNTNEASHLTRVEAEKILESEITKNMARISTRSTLFWVPNIPANWNTTGSVFYSTGINREHEPIPYDEGAFFLLPDVLDDYDIFAQDLPVQYGPGASNLPYFYGSGQNVFQVSLGKEKQPKMFGEVLSLAVTHNNLITALGVSANENLAYAVNGQRLGQLEAAINFESTGDATKAIIPMTEAEHAAASARAEIKGNKIINNAYGAQSALVKSFKSNKRFKHALALGTNGTLLVLDGDGLAGPNKSMLTADLPTTNSSGPAQSASYHIKSRVATFLRWPTLARITVLGDPNLLRLGPGCFELFSYYPVEHKDGTVTQELNTLTSGVYIVSTIEHNISGGDFTTSMSGSKVIGPLNVPSSITNKLFTRLISKIAKNDSNNTSNNNINNDILHEFQIVDLNSSTFTEGILGQELKNVFTTYSSAQTKPQ